VTQHYIAEEEIPNMQGNQGFVTVTFSSVSKTVLWADFENVPETLETIRVSGENANVW
jgi:hypothetical protein